jgi:hypothetical protein
VNLVNLGKEEGDFVAERCRRTTMTRPTQLCNWRWMNIYTNVVKTISNGSRQSNGDSMSKEVREDSDSDILLGIW